MKPAFERTPLRQWESFHCEEVSGSSYHATWHFHPECQLTLVLKSQGYRLVGDKIAPLKPGDLVLVGANLPHVWYQDRAAEKTPGSVHAIVVRFLETFLGREMLQVPEMRGVMQLFKRARRGLEVRGQTRELVAEQMKQLPPKQGLDRVAHLLSILHTLASSAELKPIASPGFAPVLSNGDHSRVERVIGFIHQNMSAPIERAEIAAKANLSEGAFSRFFKLRMGMTLPRYVNELRVGRACRLLANEQLKVTDIAWECGFTNLANFNRRFQEITGVNPSDYRKRLAR